jgi:NAD(P)-dependent dehydrogenase (short-subunit alcohol dehydrogenase family)
VQAAGFQADIAGQTAALRAADEIEARFGAIDVLEHSPTPSPPGREYGSAAGRMFSGPLDVDVPRLVPLLDLYLLAPIALVRRVLPGMRERGHGGLLFAMGAAALTGASGQGG